MLKQKGFFVVIEILDKLCRIISGGDPKFLKEASVPGYQLVVVWSIFETQTHENEGKKGSGESTVSPYVS